MLCSRAILGAFLVSIFFDEKHAGIVVFEHLLRVNGFLGKILDVCTLASVACLDRARRMHNGIWITESTSS